MECEPAHVAMPSQPTTSEGCFQASWLRRCSTVVCQQKTELFRDLRLEDQRPAYARTSEQRREDVGYGSLQAELLLQ
jgi:hypothetical protein